MKRRVLCGMLVLLLLVSLNGALIPDVLAAGEEDVTNQLVNTSLIVKQNGQEIALGGTFTFGQDLQISLSFEIPQQTDDEGTTLLISQNDYAIFDISGFELDSASDEIPLTAELDGVTVTVAHARFETSDGKNTIRITFDGTDLEGKDIFDPANGYYDVACTLDASLKYTASGEETLGEGQTVELLGKTFTVVPRAIDYTVTKTGQFSDDKSSVDWTVTVSAVREGSGVNTSLAGLTLTDDLTSVGEYQDNSFAVVGDTVSVANLTVPTESNKTLSYLFPEGTMSPQTITFSTQLPDDFAYTGGTITNACDLKDGTGGQLAHSSCPVTYSPVWITKSGSVSEDFTGAYSPANSEITWTITVGQPGVALKNVRVTDVLPTTPQELEVVSADWHGGGIPDISFDSVPADQIYSIGDITGQGTLTIIRQPF